MEYPLDDNILSAVRQLQRYLGGGVLPRHVQAWLPLSASEWCIRRYMIRLAKTGKLVRVGGWGARQGYRLPTAVERIAFQLTGRWPWGTVPERPTLRLYPIVEFRELRKTA